MEGTGARSNSQSKNWELQTGKGTGREFWDRDRKIWDTKTGNVGTKREFWDRERGNFGIQIGISGTQGILRQTGNFRIQTGNFGTKKEFWDIQNFRTHREF